MGRVAVSASRLRQDIYRLLDDVIATGDPLVVERRGHRLSIILDEEVEHVPMKGKLANLRPHPGFITGDPSDLDEITWADAWQP